MPRPASDTRRAGRRWSTESVSAADSRPAVTVDAVRQPGRPRRGRRRPPGERGAGGGRDPAAVPQRAGPGDDRPGATWCTSAAPACARWSPFCCRTTGCRSSHPPGPRPRRPWTSQAHLSCRPRPDPRQVTAAASGASLPSTRISTRWIVSVGMLDDAPRPRAPTSRASHVATTVLVPSAPTSTSSYVTPASYGDARPG